MIIKDNLQTSSALKKEPSSTTCSSKTVAGKFSITSKFYSFFIFIFDVLLNFIFVLIYSINQSINQSTELLQSINQSNSHHQSYSHNQSINQSIDWWMDWPKDRSIKQSSKMMAGKFQQLRNFIHFSFLIQFLILFRYHYFYCSNIIWWTVEFFYFFYFFVILLHFILYWYYILIFFIQPYLYSKFSNFFFKFDFFSRIFCPFVGGIWLWVLFERFFSMISLLRWRGDCNGKNEKWFPSNYVEEITLDSRRDSLSDTNTLFGAEQLGAFELSSCTIQELPPDAQAKSFAFRLLTPNRPTPIDIACESTEDLKSWLDAIKEVVRTSTALVKIRDANAGHFSKSLSLDWLIDFPVDWSLDWLIDWSFDRLIVRLIDWLLDWLIVWLIDWWIERLIDWFFKSDWSRIERTILFFIQSQSTIRKEQSFNCARELSNIIVYCISGVPFDPNGTFRLLSSTKWCWIFCFIFQWRLLTFGQCPRFRRPKWNGGSVRSGAKYFSSSFSHNWLEQGHFFEAKYGRS